MDPKRIANVTEGQPTARASAIAYPFVTRKEIAARIATDAGFAGDCALVLEARAQQRTAGGAPAGRPWGWMSSERVVAGRLVAKLRGGSLNGSEQVKLTGLVRRYSRQLADHCRGLTLKENPALSALAAKFGALPAGSAPPILAQGQPEPKEAAERCPDEDDHQPDEVESAPDDELAPRVMDFVERSPGQRTDAIAKMLDTTTAMLAPTLRMLVQGKRLKKQGFGRGTRYFVR